MSSSTHTLIYNYKDRRLYGVGSNAHNEIAQGIGDKVATPTAITFFDDKIIELFATGEGFSLVVCSGELYGFGKSWGSGFKNGSDRPQLIPLFCNTSRDILMIAAGGENSLVATRHGLAVFGDNKKGTLGLQESNVLPRYHPFFKSHQISSIAVGFYHALVATDRGLYTMGDNTSFQLGVKTTESDVVPTLVPLPITTEDKIIISRVSCGLYFSLVLTRDFGLWGFGDNVNAQLGLGDKTRRRSIVKLTFFDEIDIKDISCGGCHTFVTSKDSIWVFGYSSNGRLGLGSVSDQATPVKMQFFEKKQVLQASGRRWSSFVCTSDGLYSFGDSDEGSLGHGDLQTQTTPKCVQFFADNPKIELLGEGNWFEKAEILLLLLKVRTFDKESPLFKENLPLDLFKLLTQTYLGLQHYLPPLIQK